MRAIVYQDTTLVGVMAFAAYIIHNTMDNLSRQGIASGFGFLSQPAGFGIPQTLIEYSELSPNARVFWVGLLNTLLVAVVGIALATILGFVIGLARLSSNWLVARLATVYIEVIRNTPVLLQILFWYFAVLQARRSRATASLSGRPVLSEQPGLLRPSRSSSLRLGGAGLCGGARRSDRHRALGQAAARGRPASRFTRSMSASAC